MPPTIHSSTNLTSKSNEFPLAHGKRLLEPVERISEILFGVIMILTVTCATSIAHHNETAVKNMLIAAIGSNMAWGLIDSVMYVFETLATKGHAFQILKFVKKTNDKERACALISQKLPDVITEALGVQGIENLRSGLAILPENKFKPRLTLEDLMVSGQLFLIMFFSTIPVSLPFIFLDDPQLALRVSNVIALVLMFICGYSLALYGGYNKILTGLTLALVGFVLVITTIAFGG